MKKVAAYKRETTVRLKLRQQPDLSAPSLMTLPIGCVFWVWEEDTDRADQKDSYLWARVGVSVNENPALKIPGNAQNIAGFVALFEMKPFTKRF
jgi:hypothetical protein